jgi:hypothetical protein
MLFEWCREYPGAGQRLHPKKKKVRDEKQLERWRVRLFLSLDVRHGQCARSRQQASDAAEERAVNAGASLGNLAQEAAESEIVRAEWTFSAGRAKARGHSAIAVRTRPPFGGNAFTLHRGDHWKTSVSWEFQAPSHLGVASLYYIIAFLRCLDCGIIPNLRVAWLIMEPAIGRELAPKSPADATWPRNARTAKAARIETEA